MHFSAERKVQRVNALRGIIIGRWFLIIGLATLAFIQRVADLAIVNLSSQVWILLVVIPIAYNALFALYVRRSPDRMSSRMLGLVTFLQIFIDQIVFTVIIYLTGGVESLAYILYFFPILSATILYSDLEIISLSILTVFLYSAMIILEFNGMVPHVIHYTFDPGFFGNAEVTLSNTIVVDLVLLFMGMFSVFVNRTIHDRELQITVERDKVRSILNLLEDGIIMLDTEKRVLLMNPPARDMLRLYDNFIGPDLRKEDFPDSFSQLITSIREQTDTKRLGQELLIQEGENKSYIELDSIPIYASNGAVLSWVKVLHDSTREKELDEIKSDFISVAAHQLRTPLAALKWFFKIMTEGDAGDITEKQKDLLEKAYLRNNEVIEIVNNLLDVSEIEEGRFPFDFTEGDLTEVFATVVQRAQLDAERKGITIDFHRPESMPAVEMDIQKMRIALQNLVDNAVKYSSTGSTVTVTIEMKNNRFFASIADNGIGISQEEQQKIFSKFFRGTNAKEKETTGSGLGLYIVKNIIQKHRGQIWFDSKEHKGTTFYISLPIESKYLN